MLQLPEGAARVRPGQRAGQPGHAVDLEAERHSLDKYLQDHQVEPTVQELLQALLEARPADPRQWLLNQIEQELSEESDDLSESDLHRIFAVTRKITAEIVPQETINMVISETLKLLNCDTVSLFVLDKKLNMLRLYASNLETPIMVSPGQGIAGTVFNTRETVNIPDCYKDGRFDKSFDLKSGYVTKSLIAVPIVDFDGVSVGVIQAINKLPRVLPGAPTYKGKQAGMHAVPFLRNDEKILLHLTQHVSIAMRNADVYREAISSTERATGLLNTIQSLSQDLGTQSLLLTITMHANKVVSAQRSTVFLVDEPNQQLWSVSTDTGQEIRIPKKAGIAGQCCCEGRTINIPDAYADRRFNQEIDRKTGFRTVSILAIPIFSNEGLGQEVAGTIGVIQMINKISYDGQLEQFDEDDVEVMELFAKFVGPRLASSSMLSRRQVENTDRKEAELALGAGTSVPGMEGPDARKRASAFALNVLGEERDEEQAEVPAPPGPPADEAAAAP